METKPLKILAVDDTEINLSLLSRFFCKQGYEIIVASNGQQALERFESEQPDLILMDVMMPVMGGYDATREIRRRSGDHWIPIIFMSAKACIDDQVMGLEAGADDYLTKPLNMRMLEAKIKAMQRIIAMQVAMTTQAKELATYQAKAEEEKVLGNVLIERMTRASDLSDEYLDSWLLPAERMNGDLVAAYRGGDDRLYVMVADATGHGLLAAMMEIPVSQTFYHMTSRGYSLSRIVTSMNSQLRVLMPRDRFVAATLIMVDARNRLIEIWNGSAPDALFVDKERNIVHRFESNAAPLGVVPEESFEPQTQIYQWQTGGELLVCSDGAIDALNYAGQPFGEERLAESLACRQDQSVCLSVAEALQEYLQGQPAQDDISVISVRCSCGSPSIFQTA